LPASMPWYTETRRTTFQASLKRAAAGAATPPNPRWTSWSRREAKGKGKGRKERKAIAQKKCNPKTRRKPEGKAICTGKKSKEIKERGRRKKHSGAEAHCLNSVKVRKRRVSHRGSYRDIPMHNATP